MCDLGTIVETAIEKMKGIVSKIPESFFIKKSQIAYLLRRQVFMRLP